MKKDTLIYIAGHRGMVGSALMRKFRQEGFQRLLTASRQELDLCHPDAVKKFYNQHRPEVVIIAAAKVGGILANQEQPVEFLLENLQIQNHLIAGAHEIGVQKLLFLGSSCIYPKHAPQPIREESLLTGPLEPTNASYAIAKIAGIQLCQSYAKQYGDCFISAMPTNLYGPYDNFDLHTSHVLPALIHKVYLAQQTRASSITLWGTGTPRREFLHVDDLADACYFLLCNYHSPEVINIGCGKDITIRELAEQVCTALKFTGELIFDPQYPDGTPRKLLDMSRLFQQGWRPKISLPEGIASTTDWFVKQLQEQSDIKRA